MAVRPERARHGEQLDGRCVVTRPIMIDLFCKAGGAGMGYHRAGFEVVGCDVENQPRYPFGFVQCDWRDGLARWLEWAAKYRPGARVAVHASPPCQAYTTGGRVRERESNGLA